MRIPLKVAIVKSGETQRELAFKTRIPEVRLSLLVRGRANPTPRERSALERLLGPNVFEDEG